MSPLFDDPEDLELSASAADGLPSLRSSPKLDTSVAHSARVWNYWLGGKDHYPADREVGDKLQEMLPSIVEQARADRAFLGRAVRYLAGDQVIRQFLDIGTGLPTVDNTHEVAQRVAPESRIVYVDSDPLVLVHARALLSSTPEGVCDYIDADLHDPGEILNAAAKTLDFSQPIALMLLGIVHHIADTDQASAIVSRLVAALPPGSFLAINHASNAVHGATSDEAVRHWNQFGKPPITLRSPEQIARFFDGLELVEPGIVSCSRWRPETIPWGKPGEVDEFCGVGRKLLKGRM
jgi:O-methyltransferase involved in polyketide biosynthesis